MVSSGSRAVPYGLLLTLHVAVSSMTSKPADASNNVSPLASVTHQFDWSKLKL